MPYGITSKTASCLTECSRAMGKPEVILGLREQGVGVEKVGAAFGRCGLEPGILTYSVPPLLVPMQWQVPVVSLAG